MVFRLRFGDIDLIVIVEIAGGNELGTPARASVQPNVMMDQLIVGNLVGQRSELAAMLSMRLLASVLLGGGGLRSIGIWPIVLATSAEFLFELFDARIALGERLSQGVKRGF
jgi:hypothetical protein